ncbi:MAG: indolepyruvate oxidoreductase subunit beta family protein [Curvibacter sp.]|nr:indolepyruvate oxidoreductase subunit beta family protein [Curvibacter sp.]
MQKPTSLIRIAILAMGGEGGGVLADWIVDLAEHQGYLAQSTSVPGVAQRTGATLYYLELHPAPAAGEPPPVFALMPLPGDVDVVLASELMEAGRAVQRGLVSPGRSTLITSTHRIYSVSEKSALGDGRVDSAALLAHAAQAAGRLIAFDMARTAERHGSVISAVLFGALAAAGVLPFSRAQFEATIERGGVGTQASLKAFAAAWTEAAEPLHSPSPDEAARSSGLPRHAAHPEVDALLQRLHAQLPEAAKGLAIEGLRRLIDYQDPAYAGLYLDRLQTLAGTDAQDRGPWLGEAARHLALWMSFEDTLRVADLKTRQTRFERVRQEQRLQAGQALALHEFMHPRIEEICDTLPAALGRWLARPHALHRWLARRTRQGRSVHTTGLRGFLLLWGLARLRRWRRATLRYQAENARIETWLDLVQDLARQSPALALEVLRCQGLVKGYGDTHARGLANFECLMAVVRRVGTRLAPATLGELREAALADEKGLQLQALLRQHGLA